MKRHGGCGGERPDLIKYIVDADAQGKWPQLLVLDIAVLGYHRTAFFRTLGEEWA